jgi:hypothetical protein
MECDSLYGFRHYPKMLALDPAHRSTSAESCSVNRRQKRKRKIFSCQSCRQKKLKCDRVYPSCGKCHDAGQAAFCAYEDSPFNSEYATPLSTGRASDESFNNHRNPTLFDHSFGYGGQYSFPPFSSDDVVAIEMGARQHSGRLERATSLNHLVGESIEYGQPSINDLTLLSQRQAVRIAILEDELNRSESKNRSMSLQDWAHSSPPRSSTKRPS